MSDVFYLRPVFPPTRLDELSQMAARAQGCFALHRVNWQMSFLSLDGSAMLCWYRAPDAESVRIALRQLGADMSGVWPGRADPPLESTATGSLRDVSVLTVVPMAVTVEAEKAVIDVVKSRGGGRVCRIGSLDGSRSIWLFRSAQVGDVSQAFATAIVPVEQIWGCRVYMPDVDSHSAEQ